MTRTRALLYGLLILAAMAVYAVRMSGEMRDFEVYWQGSAHAAAGEPLYRDDAGHYRYKYFPAFAVLLIPLAVLPLAVAKAVWFGASVVLLVLFIRLSREFLTERRASAAFVTGAVIVVLGKFFGRELVLGQANLLFGMLAVWAVLAMRARRETLAGVLIALTIAIKPYGVLFLPWLVARKQQASIAAAGLTLAIIVILPAPFYGIGGTIALYQDWWRTVTESTASTLTSFDSVSFASMFAKWLVPGPLATSLATIAGIGAVAMTASVFRRRADVRFPEAIEASLLLMLIPMLSPQGWDYVLLLSAPAVAVLANHLDQLPRGLKTAVVAAALLMGLSLFDVMGRRAYELFLQTSAISVCASVLMFALYALRVWKIA